MIKLIVTGLVMAIGARGSGMIVHMDVTDRAMNSFMKVAD